ncbi:adenosine deaminase [Helicobacter pylori]
MEQQLYTIPKIELHCHLDGSVSIDLLKQLSLEQDISLNEHNLYVDQNCENLEQYLRCFDEIQKVLQTADSLQRSVVDVAAQAVEDNVKYIEIRFAPLFHMEKGLSIDETIQAVVEGAKQAMSQYDIKINILVCAMRQHSHAVNKDLFNHVLQGDSTHIAGIDFAGPEAAFPPEKIQEAAQYGVEKGLNLTLHAGECGCIHNVVQSIKLGAKRIGHGVAINNDAQVLAEVKTQQVLLEICPNSNIQTQAIKDVRELNIPYLVSHGIPFLINTDNRTVTQTTLLAEYDLLLESQQLTMKDIENINKHAVKHTFLTPNEQEELLQKMK